MAKICARNNIIQKLADTDLGADPSTLKTSSIALVYSVAEYCAPVWMNSSHTKKIDLQLNKSMQIITGTIKSTPTQWFPAFSHIAPPSLCLKKSLLTEWKKCISNPSLPIHSIATALTPPLRLKLRKPPWNTATDLDNSHFCLKSAWREEWQTLNTTQSYENLDPTQLPTGFNLSREEWTTLNRIRSGHGRCGHLLHKWAALPTPNCDCRHKIQTISHIVNDYPIRKYDGCWNDFISATPNAID